MTEENKLGKKITTLREAHHLSAQDLADRCSCDLSVIEGLEAETFRRRLLPSSRSRAPSACAWERLMDDDEAFGPAYINADQMEEVARMKSLQTSSDAGRAVLLQLGGGSSVAPYGPLRHHGRPLRGHRTRAGRP